MIDFIAHLCLGALGAGALALAITRSRAGEPIRRLFSKSVTGKHLIHCPFCTAFWVSAGVFSLVAADAGQGFKTIIVGFLATWAIASMVAGAIFTLLGGHPARTEPDHKDTEK